MSQILITGGGGLVGLNAARALAAEGTSVVITARSGGWPYRIEGHTDVDVVRYVLDTNASAE